MRRGVYDSRVTPGQKGRGRPGQRARAAVRAAYYPDAWACHICGEPIAEGEPWDTDHLIPVSRGGGDEVANLRPSHRRCNRARGAGPAPRHWPA